MASSLVSDSLIPVDVVVDDSMIRVAFNGGLQIATPVARFPRLAGATPSQRAQWRLIGRGDGIHWPAVDEDISVRTLLSQPGRKPASRTEEVPALIANLLKTTQGLTSLFEDQSFNLDGYLASSVGKVIAEYVYGVHLEPSGSSQISARTEEGLSVQVKLIGPHATSFAFRWASSVRNDPPDLLIALKLTDIGFEEIYNGPFPQDFLVGRPGTANGQLKVLASKLRASNPSLLPRKRSFDSINRWVASGLQEVA